MTHEEIEAAVKRVDRALLLAWGLAQGITSLQPTDQVEMEVARSDMAAIRIYLREHP